MNPVKSSVSAGCMLLAAAFAAPAQACMVEGLTDHATRPPALIVIGGIGHIRPVDANNTGFNYKLVVKRWIKGRRRSGLTVYDEIPTGFSCDHRDPKNHLPAPGSAAAADPDALWRIEIDQQEGRFRVIRAARLETQPDDSVAQPETAPAR